MAGRLERVVLYRLRARGDATDDSDYDIAVFLRNLSDRMAKSDRIALAATERFLKRKDGKLKTKITWLSIGVVIGALGMYLYVYNALSHLFGK